MPVTWNPADKSDDIALSGENLVATSTSGAEKLVRATHGFSAGKPFWRITFTAAAVSMGNLTIGVATSSAPLGSLLGVDSVSGSQGWGYTGDGVYGYKVHDAVSVLYGLSPVVGDSYGIALDMDAGTLEILGPDDVSMGVMYTGLTGTLYPAASLWDTGDVLTADFSPTVPAALVTAGFVTADEAAGGAVASVAAPISYGSAALIVAPIAYAAASEVAAPIFHNPELASVEIVAPISNSYQTLIVTPISSSYQALIVAPVSCSLDRTVTAAITHRIPALHEIAAPWRLLGASTEVSAPIGMGAAAEIAASIRHIAPAVREITSLWVLQGANAEVLVPIGYQAEISITAPITHSLPASREIAAPIRMTEAATAEVVARWALLENTPRFREITARWRLASDAVDPIIDATLTMVRVGDGRIFDLVDFGFQGDEDSWLWSFTAEIAALEDWAALAIGNTVSVDFAGEEFRFVIEGKSDRTADGDVSFSVSGRSPSLILERGAASVAVTVGQSAQSTVEGLCDSAGLSLDWSAVDWPLPGDQLGAGSQSPIQIIQTVAAAVGAVVQTSPLGDTLIVRPRHVVPPSRYATATPDHELSAEAHLLSAGGEYEYRPGYDSIDIMDSDAAAEGLARQYRWESAADGDARLLSLYVVPWKSVVNLQTSATGHVDISYQGVTTDDLEELIEIVEGKGSVSKPCVSLASQEYRYTDLGDVTISEGGDVTTTVRDNSLLLVNYTTRRHVWRIAADTDKVQVFVEE
jgi:hypothetical protein